jgi:L-lactate utilization protein LutB
MNKDFVYNYLDKRNAALPKNRQEILREEIYQLKKSAIGDLKNLVAIAKVNLEKSGAKVYIVKDRQAATQKITELISGKQVVKAKSNLLDKLGLKEVLGERLTETDLGAYIVSQIGGDSDHPVLPAIELSALEIAQKFGAKFGGDYPSNPKQLTDKLKKEIKVKILAADVGLTGANAVTADGQIMLLENEGNISLITRLPQTHIAVCGLEKIVASAEAAVKIAQAAAVWGTGQLQPTYISFIAGPSKTADIENELVLGVQGAQELILILIEGEVYGKIGTPEEESLYCIHCGACYNLCATWNLTGMMPKSNSVSTVYDCTLCQNCTFNCPAKINWQNIVRISRDRYNKEGKNTPHNLKMIENVRQFGNPFGENMEGKTPDELFCC